MKNASIIIPVLIATILTSIGCKKSNSTSTIVSAVDSGRFFFHLHTNVDTNEVTYGTVYTTTEGRKISVSIAQLYISHIQLVKADGSIYSIPNTMLLKQQETEQYYISMVPVGDYKSVRFSVGLDSTANTYSATADTALNHPEMWFGMSAQPYGYIYLKFKGSIDTTTNANGTTALMQPFMYAIGTNAHYNVVSLPDHNPIYSVTKGSSCEAHITIDYNKLFSGIILNNNSNLMIVSKSDNSSALSNSISNNIPSMFSYED